MRADVRLAVAALALALGGSFAVKVARGAPHASASGAPLEIDWRTSALDLDLRGMNGERYALRCPPGATALGRVVGSGPYTDISSICAASVHAGVIDRDAGGVVTIEIRPGSADYGSTTRNGIHSESLHARWSGDFVVLGAKGTRLQPAR